MDGRRIKDILKVAMSWETSGTKPELPNIDGLQDLFSSNEATKDQIEEHCRLVWLVEDFNHAYSVNLTCCITTKQTTKAEINVVLN